MWNYVRLSPSAAEVLDEGEGLGHVGESEICSRGHFLILLFSF